MELKDILAKCDHTLLTQTATWEEIRAVCDDGMKYHTASVCIPASYVKQAKDYVGGKLAICTVIGFPNGYDTTKAKCFEATDAVENGADEVDMVINLSKAATGDWDAVEADIRAVREAIPNALLKVIIESAVLDDDAIVAACRASESAGADFVKTSTGFHPAGGASAHAVKIMRDTVGDRLGVKASGGIRDAAAAEEMIAAGASRLGLSSSAAVLEGLE